jgi:hypothetical protein
MRKSNAPAAASPDIATLKQRIVELRARGRELQAEQVKLEQASEPDEPAGAAFDVAAAARAFAAGTSLDHPPVKMEGSRLNTVRGERVAIERAIDEINIQLGALVLERAQAELERRGAEWRALIRETATAICEVQRLHRKRERIAKEIKGPTGMTIAGEFPAMKIGGFGTGGTGFDEFLIKVCQLGIITEGEITRARTEK